VSAHAGEASGDSASTGAQVTYVEPENGSSSPAYTAKSIIATEPDTEKLLQDPYERYESPLGSSYWCEQGDSWVTDRDGRTVPRDGQFEVLYDALTGEPQCLALTRTELIGREDDEYGSAIGQDFSALYDLDGNLLYDWDAYIYRAGFGDFIVRQKSMEVSNYASWEDNTSELWDFRANRVLLADAYTAERLSDDRVLITDISGRPIGVMDAAGRMVTKTISEGYSGARVWNGHIIARDESGNDGREREVLLTADFTTVLTAESFWPGAAKNAIFRRGGSDTGDSYLAIINLRGEEIYEVLSAPNIIYFDDEIIATRAADKYSIVRMADGKVLAGGFEKEIFEEYMFYLKYYSNPPVPFEHFAFYKDGVLSVIDRDGNVTGQKAFPAVDKINLLGDGLFEVSVGEPYHEGNKTGIFDTELNEIIPAETYEYIGRATRRTTREPWITYPDAEVIPYDLFLCTRHEGSGGTSFTDVRDMSGNMLTEGLNEVYEVGPDRLAVRKGFDIGLMDWNGNWIVRRSMFADLID
jgi:hypothetical protein